MMNYLRPMIVPIALHVVTSAYAADGANTTDSMPVLPPTAFATSDTPSQSSSSAVPNSSAPSRQAKQKQQRQPTPPDPALETFASAAQQPIPGTERVIYDRAPLRVVLGAGRERRVHLPWEAALHLPADSGALQAQIVGATLYLTGQSGQPTIRAIVEGLDGQGMVPLDIQVHDQLAGVPDEMEIAVATRGGPKDQRGRLGKESDDEDEHEPAPPDLVQLTRHCSQQVYAPQRLVKTPPGVRPVNVRSTPVAGLYRGGGVITTPIGAWRSTHHHVTAVRFTNRTTEPIELDMEMLRGHWVAATPQHYLLASAGSESDTTAVCLISEQAFDASRP
jgi:integrating conjugative element protein (TIGR03749 family)